MKTFKDYLTEAPDKPEKIFFDTKKDLSNMSSLWFILSAKADEKIQKELKKVKGLGQEILKAPDSQEDTPNISLRVGKAVYGYYKEYGVGRIGAGGGYDKAGAKHSKYELEDIILDTEFSSPK